MYARQLVTLFSGKKSLPQQTAAVAALFANGEQGAWYDPSDFSTLFQDSAGTTPVTAAGQSVGKILDKSGRGNHATQATGTKQPTIQQDASGYWHLLFDGINDSLVTSAADFTGTNKMTVWAGVRKLSDAADGFIIGLGDQPGAVSATMSIQAPGSSMATKFQISSRGTATATPFTTSASFNAPVSAVVAGALDISAPSARLRMNGADISTSVATQGTGNYGNFPIYLGSRLGTSLPFNGRLYIAILRGAACSATEITAGEAYAKRRMGAY